MLLLAILAMSLRVLRSSSPAAVLFSSEKGSFFNKRDLLVILKRSFLGKGGLAA